MAGDAPVVGDLLLRGAGGVDAVPPGRLGEAPVVRRCGVQGVPGSGQQRGTRVLDHVGLVVLEGPDTAEALQAGDFDADLIASVPRRARHLIEVARAYRQRKDRHAIYALLDKAERTAPETVQYNGFARDMLLELSANPPSAMRAEVRALCQRVGLLD